MKFLLAALLAFSLAFASNPDSLTVRSIDPEKKVFVSSATGVWWPAQPKSSKHVVVWFHGGMTSNNCQKGFVAGEGFSKLVPDVVVVSVSACRDRHWVTGTMMAVVDAALDSVAKRRASFVEETLMDPDGMPENVLDCFVAKMCNAGKPIYWERML